MLRALSSLLQRHVPGFRPWLIWANYRLRGRRVDRNQWQVEDAPNLQRYEKMLGWSWDETRAQAPDYFARLEASVRQAHGRVLELGCGIGTMTRWIAQRPEVASVLAIDGFEPPIERLRVLGLPKVTPQVMSLEHLDLGREPRFDCVFLCELIEHLYPDEELPLLDKLRPALAPGATFVVSTPIGWMEDPRHVRGFSVRQFEAHLARHYGKVAGIDRSSGYSQVAWGEFSAPSTHR